MQHVLLNLPSDMPDPVVVFGPGLRCYKLVSEPGSKLGFGDFGLKTFSKDGFWKHACL